MTEYDPLRELWVSGKEEKLIMSIEEIKARSTGFQSRIKWRNTSEYLAGVLVIALFGWSAYIEPFPLLRIGALMVVAGTLCVCWQLNKIAAASATPDDASAESLASHHRSQLVRQRDALRSVWKWYMLPLVPGLLVMSLGFSIRDSATMPIWSMVTRSLIQLGFTGAVFAGVWALNARGARKLDTEINALDTTTIQ